MKFHLLEHEDFDLCGNLARWADERSCSVSRTRVHRRDPWPDPADFDWLVILGGTMCAFDETGSPWLRSEKAFLARTLAADKTVLGICFGAQLLAEALGGRVFRNPHPEIGWKPVTLTPASQKSFLFQDVPDAFTSFIWHNDHFSLSSACAPLAFSDAAPYQAFTALNRRAVGLQFHPEFTAGQIKTLLRQFAHQLVPSPHVSPLDEILAETDRRPDPYPLLETLLDNMVREFGPAGD